MNDKDIVNLYLSRDENAITYTADKYERYLTAIAYRILSDWEDSAESVNDTYLAAWDSIPPHTPSVLSTYLGKITRRISIDRFRYHHREKRISSEFAISLTELSECISDLNTPEIEAENTVLREAINSFIHELSPDARHLFIGRYYFLDTLKEVASYCGMTEARAKSILFRTRQQLSKYLLKEGFEV